ncbi:MAG: hypothetical protein KC449_30070, partial [Anaerolineales bacterium]|nr:hypothetical protein [Anaerolineales bacterium]
MDQFNYRAYRLFTIEIGPICVSSAAEAGGNLTHCPHCHKLSFLKYWVKFVVCIQKSVSSKSSLITEYRLPIMVSVL